MALNLMERVMFMRTAELCASLPDPALKVLAEVAHEHVIPAGQALFYEEDLGTELFLLIEGRVDVRKLGRRPDHDAPREECGALLTSLGPGDVVGEMSVLDDRPRSATVVAETTVRALIIHREDLRDAIALCPDLAFGLFRVLSMRLRATSAARSMTPVPRSGASGDAR